MKYYENDDIHMGVLGGENLLGTLCTFVGVLIESGRCPDEAITKISFIEIDKEEYDRLLIITKLQNKRDQGSF